MDDLWSISQRLETQFDDVPVAEKTYATKIKSF